MSKDKLYELISEYEKLDNKTENLETILYGFIALSDISDILPHLHLKFLP